MQTFDAIVIGAGGVGSAVLSDLSRRGLKVLGIDRFAPPHQRGSSHGETRVIRQAYFEHYDYVPLLRRTYDLWRELEQRSGVALFEQCGLLEVGPADGEVVPGVLRAATEHNLSIEAFAASDVAERWPSLGVPDRLAAVFEPTAGYLQVEQCVSALLGEAKQHGAQLVIDCEVTGWSANASGVEVSTTDCVYAAGALVIAAGAWAGPLLEELGVPLTPLRKSLFWYPAANVQHANDLPVFLYELEFGVAYGFPSLDGERLKIAQHDGGSPVANPLEVDQAVVPEEQRLAERFIDICLPSAKGPPVAHATCLYTMTPDGHFVVDRHPQHANVAFAAGLSGHGFKFTPVLGEALADLVLEGATKLPIGFLSAQRFQQ